MRANERACACVFDALCMHTRLISKDVVTYTCRSFMNTPWKVLREKCVERDNEGRSAVDRKITGVDVTEMLDKCLADGENDDAMWPSERPYYEAW